MSGPKFCILLHDADGQPRGVNTHHVESWAEDEHGYCVVWFSSGEGIAMRESAEEIAKLMGGYREEAP